MTTPMQDLAAALVKLDHVTKQEAADLIEQTEREAVDAFRRVLSTMSGPSGGAQIY